MPILLKKAFQPGDNDTDATDGYPMAQLVNLYHSGITMAVTLEYQFGTASGDYYETWTRGPGSPTKVTEISGMRVAQLWSTMPNEGESVGEAVRRAVYEYLINSGEVEGEIANNPPLPPEQAEQPSAPEATPAEPTAEPSPAEDEPATETAPEADPAPAEDAPADTEKAPEGSDTPEAGQPS